MNADKLCALTGYQFKQASLLDQALTHRSYSRQLNNERLEFLGDSILNLIISNYIYKRFSDADEGDLSRIRASLVKEETLALIARQIDLGDCIHLGGGELKSGGFRRASILADALEALIGAIYLDSDYARTEIAVLHLYQDKLQNIDTGANLRASNFLGSTSTQPGTRSISWLKVTASLTRNWALAFSPIATMSSGFTW